MKPIFNKVTEGIPAFYSSVKNPITCIGMFRKAYLLVISRNSSLLSTGCDAIQGELPTNVLKGVLKTLEKFQEELCNEVSV